MTRMQVEQPFNASLIDIHSHITQEQDFEDRLSRLSSLSINELHDGNPGPRPVEPPEEFLLGRKSLLMRKNIEAIGSDSHPSGIFRVTQEDPVHPATREQVQKLEKSIVFLKQEHRTMLQALQHQNERLKSKNRDLNFVLTMKTVPEELTSDSGPSTRSAPEPTLVQIHPTNDIEGKRQDQRAVSPKLEPIATLKDKVGSIQSNSVVPQSHLRLKLANHSSPRTKQDGSSMVVKEHVKSKVTSVPPMPSTPELIHQLREAEVLIERLQHEKKSQRQEILRLHSTMNKVVQLRNRGCTHPTRLLSRAQRGPSSTTRGESISTELGQSREGLLELVQHSSLLSPRKPSRNLSHHSWKKSEPKEHLPLLQLGGSKRLQHFSITSPASLPSVQNWREL